MGEGSPAKVFCILLPSPAAIITAFIIFPSPKPEREALAREIQRESARIWNTVMTIHRLLWFRYGHRSSSGKFTPGWKRALTLGSRRASISVTFHPKRKHFKIQKIDILSRYAVGVKFLLING